jgi:hypothetical protein
LIFLFFTSEIGEIVVCPQFAHSYVLGLQVRGIGQKLVRAHAFDQHLKLDGTPKAVPLAAWT